MTSEDCAKQIFQTTLYVKIFQTKIGVHVVKSHPGFGVVRFSFNLVVKMGIFINHLVKPLEN